MTTEPVHPWGEPDLVLTPDSFAAAPIELCQLCFAGDGDARCIRCGRSTGGPLVCECAEGPAIGPCAGGPG
jgi:hypothetical protein